MTLHRVRDKENTRNFLATIPPALFPMIAKCAVSCTDIDLSDHRGDDCAAVATELVAASWEAGRDALRAVVENRDDGAKSLSRDGKSWYRIPPTKGSFQCQFGGVEYTRPRYRHCGESKSLGPVDEGLGLIDGGRTRSLAKATTCLMAACPPRTVTSLLAPICNRGPSVSTLQRSTASVYKHFEEIADAVLSAVRSQEMISEEAVRVSGWFDGVMVNLRKGECPVGTEDDRGMSGSNWREVSCATMTFYDKDGNKLRPSVRVRCLRRTS